VTVVDFVALGGIPTRGQGARHVGIFVGTSLAFHFSEIALGLKLRFNGLDDWLRGFVMGLHTHPLTSLKLGAFPPKVSD
jgi:hypothetical protein